VVTTADRAALRDRLIEVAGQLLDAAGPEALQARKVAAEAGTSTQAIYTHFGGMRGVLQAVAAVSLTDFADHVREVAATDDPVADHIARGWAYALWALTHPHRYRLIFGLAGEARGAGHLDLAPAGEVADFTEGRDAFAVLVGSVARVVASGRVRPADPMVVAGQFLSVTHGYVLLEMAQAFGVDGGGAAVIEPLIINLLVGLGDDRRAAERSWQSAVARAAAAQG
jgi:AcrR family transcriptional regulator